jgi:hypothetical protein
MRKIFAIVATGCGLFVFATLAHSVGARPDTAGQKEVCQAAFKKNQAKISALSERGDKTGINALMAASGCPNTTTTFTRVEVPNDGKRAQTFNCTTSYRNGILTITCTLALLAADKVIGKSR